MIIIDSKFNAIRVATNFITNRGKANGIKSYPDFIHRALRVHRLRVYYPSKQISIVVVIFIFINAIIY